MSCPNASIVVPNPIDLEALGERRGCILLLGLVRVAVDGDCVEPCNLKEGDATFIGDSWVVIPNV